MRDLIHIGVIVELQYKPPRCRVQLGGNTTDWLQWLACRAGGARTWWAPSIGEQVVVLALGGELDTAFVLPAINSDDFPAPSVSPEAYHTRFSDGAVIEYEPETGTLSVTGIKTANISAQSGRRGFCAAGNDYRQSKITLDTPEVVCTNKLTADTLELKRAGKCRAISSTAAGPSSLTACRWINTVTVVCNAAETGRRNPMTVRYIGMNRDTGQTLTDSEHISQSVRDILITPVGSRVMRREYGSLLSALIDQPQSPAVNGQVMAACYMAILKWEPRIRLTSITFEKTFSGQMFVDITGVRQDTTGGTFSLTVPLS